MSGWVSTAGTIRAGVAWGLADRHQEEISAERRIRNHVRQLEALGLTVTITPAHDAA
jgi:hypothetical protein